MTVNTGPATDSEATPGANMMFETGAEENVADQPDDSETASAATPPEDTDPSRDDDTGREAAKYRRQLRDTEAERDRLATQVEGYHRAEAERIAASRLIDASDLWASGVKLTDLLADDGSQVDPARVAQAVTDLAASRPHWCKQAAAPSRAVGFGASKPDTSGDGKGTTTWSDVLGRARSGAQDG